MISTSNNFIHDYVVLLQELARQARGVDAKPSDFDAGRGFGLYEALSLIKDQLASFGMSPSDIGIESLDPEQYLIRDKTGEDS